MKVPDAVMQHITNVTQIIRSEMNKKVPNLDLKLVRPTWHENGLGLHMHGRFKGTNMYFVVSYPKSGALEYKWEQRDEKMMIEDIKAFAKLNE